MEKLHSIMKRLLQFSGCKIDSVLESNDGFVFDCEIEGQRVRVFITEPSPNCFLPLTTTEDNEVYY